jgi:hypothetical protein
MSPGVALLVKDSEGEVITVHVGPTWFVRQIKFRNGDRVRIRGAWAEINGQEVFMASKIKRASDDLTLKVRLTKDGTPFWTMSEAELAKERADE